MAVKAKCRPRSLPIECYRWWSNLKALLEPASPQSQWQPLSSFSSAGPAGGWLDVDKLCILKASWKRHFPGLHWSWFWILFCLLFFFFNQTPTASLIPLSFSPSFCIAVPWSWLLRALSSPWNKTEKKAFKERRSGLTCQRAGPWKALWFVFSSWANHSTFPALAFLDTNQKE